MKMIEYLYTGMFVLSLVLIYFALKQYSISKELLQRGIRTKAKVIDLIAVSDSDGTTYTPVFEYRDKSTAVHTFKSPIRSSPAPYKIGDQVQIVYTKEGSQHKVVSFWGLYRWTIILLCIASPLLIIGGGYFLYSRG